MCLASSSMALAPSKSWAVCDTTVRAAYEPSPAEEARELFSRGSSSYALSKYAESVTLFEQSFLAAQDIEDDELRQRVLQALRFNLARAHVKAYEIDQDETRLRTALDLFDKYVDNGPDMDSELETAQLSTQVREELRQLAAGRVSEEAAAAEADSDADNDERSGRAEGEAGGVTEDREATPAQAKSLRIAAYAVLGMGVAGLGVMGGGMAMASSAKSAYVEAGTQADYDAALSRGKTGNLLAVSGAVASGVLVSVGTALLIVSKKKTQQIGNATASRVRLVPGVGPRSAGMWLQGAF